MKCAPESVTYMEAEYYCTTTTHCPTSADTTQQLAHMVLDCVNANQSPLSVYT